MTSHSFIAIGHSDNPRWLLPCGESGIDAALTGWQPQTWSTRLMWKGVRLAARYGKLQLLPRTRRMNLPWIDALDWGGCGWSRRHRPIPLLHLGTAGPSRKAVVHLIDRDTQCCELIVKIPFTDAAATAILREADVLEGLRRDGIPGVPRLVWKDGRRGISAQTVIGGKPDSKMITEQHWKALRTLTLRDKLVTLREHAAQLLRGLTNCGPDADLHTVQAACVQMSDSSHLRSCWIHGDFAPWNLKQQPDGTLGLVDWEDGVRGGLPLQDAYHHTHIQRHLFRGRPRPVFRELGTAAEALGINPHLLRQLELAYLTTAYLRQLEKRNRPFSQYLLSTLRIAANV